MEGRVAAHGRQYIVELEDGSLLPCFPAWQEKAMWPVATGRSIAARRPGVVEAIPATHQPALPLE